MTIVEAGESSRPRRHYEPGDGSKQWLKHESKVRKTKIKEHEFHIRLCVDLCVFAYAILLYCKDISLLRLLLRVAVQFLIMGQRTREPSSRRAALIAAAGINLYCFLHHLVFSPVVPVESSFGYLHGGLTVQIIGEKTSHYRLGLCFYDLVIAALQFLFYILATRSSDAQTVLEAEESSSSETGSSVPARPRGDGLSGQLVVERLRVRDTLAELWTQETSDIEQRTLEQGLRLEALRQRTGQLAGSVFERPETIPGGWMPGGFVFPQSFVMGNSNSASGRPTG